MQDECNTQSCVGDEICIAKQDLVLDIDGSGSLKEDGWEVVRNFAANLTGRYQGEYYGEADMRVGVVQFGNGMLQTQDDGTTTISDALYVQGLTADMVSVEATVKTLAWQKGFTNMAQGLHTADVMLGQTGRADAQSAIMVISDGKFSMEYQTAEKARELKDKNVMLYLIAITEVIGADLETFRSFSSSPHGTNFQRIPGLTALKYNAELFTGEILAKFCPKAISPSLIAQAAEQKERILIHESGYPSDSCGAWTWHGMGHTMEDCQQAAREQGLLAFAFGKGKYMYGGCYSEAIMVDDAFWQAVLADSKAPPCTSGYWIGNPYFDTYALKPVAVLSLT